MRANDANPPARRKKSLSQEFSREVIKESLLANSEANILLRKRKKATKRATDVYRRSTNLQNHSFSKEFCIFNDEKLKKIRVTIIPSEKKVVLILPFHSCVTVLEIENKIKMQL